MKGSSGRDRKTGGRRQRPDRGKGLLRDLPAGGKKRIIDVTDDQPVQRKMSSEKCFWHGIHNVYDTTDRREVVNPGKRQTEYARYNKKLYPEVTYFVG